MTAALSELLSIGDAAQRAGVPASTLRYWERAGLLRAPQRVSGKRRYDAEDLRQLELVVLAKQLGFSLAEIHVLLAGISASEPPPKLWQELAARKLPQVEQMLDEAKAMKRILEIGMRCECLTLEDCLTAMASMANRGKESG
ncbi:MAG: MerR family transcriptional regulator [Solirubrobacterales bacterium]